MVKWLLIVALLQFESRISNAFVLDLRRRSLSARRHSLKTVEVSLSDGDKKGIINRKTSKRWNGNYKHASKKLSDVTKAKKLRLELCVTDKQGNVTTRRLEKKRQESLQHVLTKALLWKLFADEYPNIQIEQDIGDPDYLPDVISLPPMSNSTGEKTEADLRDKPLMPLFWGESGRMKVHKAIDLMKRYPATDIVHCRWGMDLETLVTPLLEALQELADKDALEDLPQRTGKFTFAVLPHLELWQYIDEETGIIHIEKSELEWKELEFPEPNTQ